MADEEKTVLKIDFRIQGIPHVAVEQEDDRKREIRRLVHSVKNLPKKTHYFADLQSIRTYNSFSENPFSEESKQMIHNLGYVDCFELCDISSEIQ